MPVSPVPKIPFPPGLSQFLDLARWLSALLVVFDHMNNRLFLPTMGRIAHRDLVHQGWIFLSGFGHFAVVIFFALSGFLVGGRVIEDHRHRQFDPRIYAADRLSRIHTVLVPGLLLVLLFDKIGMAVSPAIYHQMQTNSHGLIAFLGNALLLHQFFLGFYGSDGALSTLASEFWYYVCFPLIFAPLAFRSAGGIGACLLGLAVLAFLGAQWIDFLSGAILWATGAVAAALPRRTVGGKAQLGLLLLFLGCFIGFRIGIRAWQYKIGGPFLNIGNLTDAIVALAFSALLYAMRTGTRFRMSAGPERANALFAGFSYSLYVVHVPTIDLFCSLSLAAWGMGWHSSDPGPLQWALAAACLCFVLATAFVFSRATEMHTTAIRRWCRKLFLSAFPALYPARQAAAPGS